jgi:hypothetical protein
VSYLPELQAFIKTYVGENEWANLCDSMESVAVMFHRKLAGEQLVDEQLTRPIAAMLNRLGDVELKAFEHFLEMDQFSKGIVLDAIAAAKKERGLK